LDGRNSTVLKNYRSLSEIYVNLIENGEIKSAMNVKEILEQVSTYIELIDVVFFNFYYKSLKKIIVKKFLQEFILKTKPNYPDHKYLSDAKVEMENLQKTIRDTRERNFTVYFLTIAALNNFKFYNLVFLINSQKLIHFFQIRRRNIVNEICSTEKTYVDCLRDLINVSIHFISRKLKNNYKKIY
jgi:hypothetical protein